MSQFGAQAHYIVSKISEPAGYFLRPEKERDMRYLPVSGGTQGPIREGEKEVALG